MHLGQFELGLCACSGGEAEVSDDVSQSLSLGLVFCENLSLGVVSNDLDVDKASKVELLRPEHRHVGDGVEFVRW